MNIKKYIYEFLGFATFYSIAGLTLGFDSTITCIISGIIGAVAGKFVSKVGKDTYVFDLSNGDSGSVEAEYLWHSLLRGAPRPFQLIGMYTIKRIEIVDSHFDIHKRCGSFHINVYTSFNFQKFNNLRVNEPCP